MLRQCTARNISVSALLATSVNIPLIVCLVWFLVRHNVVVLSLTHRVHHSGDGSKGSPEAPTSPVSVSRPRPDRSSVETLMAQWFNHRAQGFLFMLPADLLIFVARAEALIVALRSFCVSCSTKLAQAVRPSHTKLEQRAGHAPRIPSVHHVRITSLEFG